MTIFLSASETPSEVVLQWYSTEVGDAIVNMAGSGVLHTSILTTGKATMEIEGQSTEVIESPVILVLPVGMSYKFITITPETSMYCIYNKASGAADTVKHLVTGETIIWPDQSDVVINGPTGETGALRSPTC